MLIIDFDDAKNCADPIKKVNHTPLINYKQHDMKI